MLWASTTSASAVSMTSPIWRASATATDIGAPTPSQSSRRPAIRSRSEGARPPTGEDARPKWRTVAPAATARRAERSFWLRAGKVATIVTDPLPPTAVPASLPDVPRPPRRTGRSRWKSARLARRKGVETATIRSTQSRERSRSRDSEAARSPRPIAAHPSPRTMLPEPSHIPSGVPRAAASWMADESRMATWASAEAAPVVTEPAPRQRPFAERPP